MIDIVSIKNKLKNTILLYKLACKCEVGPTPRKSIWDTHQLLSHVGAPATGTVVTGSVTQWIDRFLLQCLYPQIEEEKSDKMTESSALTVQICLCLELGDTEGSHWCESP